ncbi:MAG: BatA domain-containing protein [Candidatus Syntrophosphaera sp.]|nr:BatA domain-containing protein [Candidatus Syntrophosphaera sp.]
MSFLNSGLLLFTAATILPLIIWLLAKKKPKRVVFPTLRFIKASQEQEKKRTRLKNILLLIIRMLIILLVTLAATRPLLQSKHLKPAQKHPPTAIAILLDTSFSLDYVRESRSDLDRAKDAVREIEALCTPQDRLVLITSDEAWNRLHAQIYAGSFPQGLISQIGVTYSPLPLANMVSLAEEKLRETQLANRELYLITDGQKQEYPVPEGQNLNVINIAQDREFDNLSCSGAAVLPQLVEKSRRQSIEFRLSNHGAEDRNEVLVKVVLGDAKVAEKFVNLPARQTVNQSIVVDIRQDGWQSGYVEVMDDRLEHDNRSHFAFPFQLAPRVAVISDRAALPLYLRSLLQVYTGPGGRIDVLDPQSINLATLNQYQTFVLQASTHLSPKLRELVETLRSGGRGVLFCLDQNLSPEQKTWLGGLFGVSIGAFQAREGSIGYVNPHHFTTSLMAGKNIQYKGITGFWQISGTDATTLLAGGGDVFALAKDNFLLWNFDLASQRSAFFLDAAFAVFAYRSLEYTSSIIASGESHALGDAVSAHQVVLPDGSVLVLANRTHTLAQPGIYTLRKADGSETLLAVDTPRQESEFEPMDYKGLKNVKLLGANWQNALFHTRLGHDLWKILMAAALLLVVLEIILVKAEELRPTSAAKNPSTGSTT